MKKTISLLIIVIAILILGAGFYILAANGFLPGMKMANAPVPEKIVSVQDVSSTHDKEDTKSASSVQDEKLSQVVDYIRGKFLDFKSLVPKAELEDQVAEREISFKYGINENDSSYYSEKVIAKCLFLKYGPLDQNETHNKEFLKAKGIINNIFSEKMFGENWEYNKYDKYDPTGYGSESSALHSYGYVIQSEHIFCKNFFHSNSFSGSEYICCGRGTHDLLPDRHDSATQ